MANNFQLSAGTGDGPIVATDEISTIHYQRMKLADGTEDSTTLIHSGNGVAANALRVTLASDSTGVLSIDDNDDSLTVDNAGINTIAGAVSGTEMQVDLVAITPDLMLGSDFSNVFGTSALYTNGTLGDGIATGLDVVNVRNFNYVYNGASFDLVREGDSPGSVLVDLGTNNEVTVSGTVTVDASGATVPVSNAHLTSLGAAINTSRVDVTADSVTLGHLAAIETAAELIDDAIGADDSPFTLTSDKVMVAGAIQDAVLSDLVAVDGDRVPLRVDANGALHVIDSNGTQYTLGTSTYSEGTSVGTIASVVRKDTGASLVDTDNEITSLQVNSVGELRVAGGGGGTQYTQGDTAAATPTGNAQIFVREDGPVSVAADGQYVAARATVYGAMYAQLIGTDGTFINKSAFANVGSINDETVLVGNGVAGNGAQRVCIASDSDVLVNNPGLTELAAAINTSRLDINLDATATAHLQQIEAAIEGTLTVASHAVTNAGTFAVQTEGDLANSAVDSGNPVKIGGKAVAFDGTPPLILASENDRIDAAFTPQGIQYVETAHPNHWSASSDYASAQTNATIKAAPGAALKLYITDIIISNGATAGNITLLDGSGGSVIFEIYPAVNGGATHAFRTPIPLTTNTLLAITSTTVTTHAVTVSGFVAP